MSNKLYAFSFLLLILFSGKSFSQSLTMTMPDTTDTDSCGMDIFFTGDSVFNNTPNNLDVDVVRVQNVTTPNWQSAFCLDVCYLPSKDSVRFTLQPNERQVFIFHFYTDAAAAASGTATMKFKNVTTPSNTLYQTFYGSSVCANAVNELFANSANVNIYPMPITAGNDFTLSVSNVTSNSKQLSLSVYDIFGKHMKTSSIIEGINFMNLDLSGGVYSYSLLSENTKLNSGKLVVSK